MTEQINECRELLAKWDNGEIVRTIEMGGIGPGYEQALQICGFEMIRYMIDNVPDWDKCEKDSGEWDKWRDGRDAVLFADDGPCKNYGLSGVQVGAAGNLASMFVRNGPETAVEMAEKDRQIMVSKNFPEAK